MNVNSTLIGTDDPAPLAAYLAKLFGEPGWDEGGASVAYASEIHYFSSAARRALSSTYSSGSCSRSARSTV